MAGRMGVTGRLTLVTVSLVGLLAAQSPTPALGEDCTITDPHGWQKGIDGYWTEIYTKWYDMNKSFVMASLAWEAEDAIYDEMHSTEEILGNKEPCPNNGTTHDIKKCESYNEGTVYGKIDAILKKTASYKNTIDVVAGITGALFMYIAKFGYLSRIVGMVSPQNIKATIVSDLLATALAVLSWWSLGYGFTYGKDNYPEDGMGVLGGDRFFPMHANPLSDIVGGGAETDDSSFIHIEFLLHMGLSIICVGIPVGTLAERATLTFTILSSLLLAMLIYPMIAHMIWHEDGRFSAYREKELLFDCGVIDTAGSGVVHAVGGIVALSAAVIIDGRFGRWKYGESEGAKPELMPKPQYSPAFEAFGCVIIFVTSLATTAFCVKRYTDDGTAVGRAMLNNLLCSGTSSFTACVIGHFYTGVISPQLAGGGLIAGIATISSGCAVVTPEGAFIMGFVGGVAYYLGGALLVTIRVDDVSHAISMHGFAGICGLVMTGLFAHPDFYEQTFYDTRLYDSGCYGMFYNGGPTATLAQAWAAMTIIAIAGTVSTIVFAVFHLTAGGRFPDKMLETGIDAARFGGETRYADATADVDPDRFKHINPAMEHDDD